MSFLAPALLIGLLAAAIPPIIHLILRRQPKRVPFAAMEFIMRANRKAARRFKIRQFLLMSTRSLLLATVAFSIARPVFEEEHLGSARKVSAKGALVLVIDASFEMGYRLEGETLLDRSRFKAESFLDGFEGTAGILVAGNTVDSPLDGLTGDLEAVRTQVAQTELSQQTGSLAEAVAQAEALLDGREADEPGAVIVFTTPGRFAALPPISSDHKAQRLLADASDGQRLPNRAVTAVNIRPAPKFGLNHWRVDARIANYTEDATPRLAVRIDVGGKTRVRGFVSLDAGAERTKSFYLQAEDKLAQTAEVIIEGDQLELDDRRSFWFEAARSIAVLAVNGDPQPTPHLDELFYLERALESAGSTGIRIDVEVITIDQMKTKSLTDYDVVILSNPSGVVAESGRQLIRFVEGGGGLLTTVGNRVVPKALNQGLGRLLPRPLRSVRRAGDAASSKEGRDRFFGRLGDFNTAHPILAGLGPLENGSLSRARIQKYMLVEPVPGGGGEVVIALDEGAPFLVTKELGRGRTALLNGTIDRDWGDLPIRADFLPLMHRLVGFLARSYRTETQMVHVGDPITVPTDDPRVKAVKVQAPNGDRFLTERPSIDKKWLFKKTQRAGHYRFLADPPLPEGEALAGVVVGLNPQGSDLRHRASGDETSSDEEEELAAPTPGKNRTELWHAALLMLFLLLASEAYLLMRSPQSAGRNMTGENSLSGV